MPFKERRGPEGILQGPASCIFRITTSPNLAYSHAADRVKRSSGFDARRDPSPGRQAQPSQFARTLSACESSPRTSAVPLRWQDPNIDKSRPAAFTTRSSLVTVRLRGSLGVAGIAVAGGLAWRKGRGCGRRYSRSVRGGNVLASGSPGNSSGPRRRWSARRPRPSVTGSGRLLPSERERKKLYIEDRKAEAAAMAADVRPGLAELDELLRLAFVTGRSSRSPPFGGLMPTRRLTRVSSASHCLPQYGSLSPRHRRPG